MPPRTRLLLTALVAVLLVAHAVVGRREGVVAAMPAVPPPATGAPR